jgi:hypothetical protein
MARRYHAKESSGRLHSLIDEDTVDGFPRLTVFMMCNKRATVWHLPSVQPLSALVVPSLTLCGIRPYAQGADVKRSWDDVDGVNVCINCEQLRKEI